MNDIVCHGIYENLRTGLMNGSWRGELSQRIWMEWVFRQKKSDDRMTGWRKSGVGVHILAGLPRVAGSANVKA
jgi:hypothetical protein